MRISVVGVLLALLVLVSSSVSAGELNKCVVYLSWDSPFKDLVEKEVKANALIGRANAEKAQVKFYEVSSLAELSAVAEKCREVYLFLAGHSDKDLIGHYTPQEVKETLTNLVKKGVHFPLIVFDTCYWGEVYRLRYFAFPGTVVVGSIGEELQYGLKGIYLNLDKVVALQGDGLVREVLNDFYSFYYPKYQKRGKELTEYGFRCQTVRVYYKGVVSSESVCFDRRK